RIRLRDDDGRFLCCCVVLCKGGPVNGSSQVKWARRVHFAGMTKLMKKPMDSCPDIYFQLEERAGIKRIHEPVTIGFPLPQGMVSDSGCLTLWDASGCQLPLQAHPLANWFDGSVKWVLLDFQANIEAKTRLTYQIRCISDPFIWYQSPSLSVQESPEQIVVETGKVTFFVNRQLCKPFDRVVIKGAE